MERRGFIFILDGRYRASGVVKYVPFIGRFVVDMGYVEQFKPYYSTVQPKPKAFRVLTFLENTLLYVMVGAVIAAMNLSLLPFIPIFIASALVEWALIRKHGSRIELFNWSTISKIPTRLAAKMLFLTMYHAFLFMILGYFLVIILR